MERLHLLVDEHRRLLAAVLGGLAVLAALSALRQAPPTQSIVVARHDLHSGQLVASADVRTTSVTPGSAPAHTLDRDEVIGRRVAGPMRAGEPMTDFRVVGPGSLAAYGEDAVLTTIRVDQTDVAALDVGSRVDVVAVDPGGETPAEVVARDVEVVTVPGADDAQAVALGVVTTEEGALALAEAGLSSRLSVITSSRGVAKVE
jgi:Flp pilus assembly protein CpaB